MLYEILSNRNCVNLLKRLSENDKNKQYSTKLTDIDVNDIYGTITVLKDHELVYLEDGLISISEKGKAFVDLIDQLKDIIEKKEERRESNVEIHYDLTDIEKRTLLLVLKLQQETGRPSSLASITREMFPYEHINRKKNNVSKQLKKLEELNLIERHKVNREAYFEMTFAGMKLAKSQLFTEISRIL